MDFWFASCYCFALDIWWRNMNRLFHVYLSWCKTFLRNMSNWNWFIIHLLEFYSVCVLRQKRSLILLPIHSSSKWLSDMLHATMCLRYSTIIKLLSTSCRRKFQLYVSNIRRSLGGPLFCYNGIWMLNDGSVNFIHFDTTKLNTAVCRCLIQLNVCFWHEKGHHGPVFILFDSMIYQSSPFLSFLVND